VHFHSVYVFPAIMVSRDSRFLRLCWDIPASWADASHSRDGSCSDRGDLFEAGPGSPLVQALLPHQSNFSCSDTGPGHGWETGKCCRLPCFQCPPFCLLFSLSFKNMFLLFSVRAEQACMTVWHQLFHGESVRGKEEMFTIHCLIFNES